MGSDHIIRDATDEDAAAVADIFDHYIRETVTTFETEPRGAHQWQLSWASLRELGWPVLVAVVDDHVAGFAYVGPWRSKPAYKHTVETTVYLSPSHRGRGLGRALSHELHTRAHQAGAMQVIAVIAHSGDPASRALHAKLGFQSVGILSSVGRKFDRWVDVELMQKSLP